MGFDPGTGDELVPITKEMVALWRDQEKKRNEDEGRKKTEEARQAPQLIDPETYNPFDPLSGKPHSLRVGRRSEIGFLSLAW